MDSQIVRATLPRWLWFGPAAVGTGSFGLAGASTAVAVADGAVMGLAWWAVAAAAVLVLVPPLPLVAYLVLRQRNLRLELTDCGLSHVDVRGRRTRIARGQIVAVYRTPVQTSRDGGEVTMVTGSSHRALISLWHRDWDEHQLDRLWSELGLRSTYYPVVGLTAARARTEFPGVRLPVSFAHPVRTAALSIAGALAVIASWVWLLVALAR